jgi:hypothetical protein
MQGRILFVTLLLTASCMDSPSDQSATCQRDADCGTCGRCEDGRCKPAAGQIILQPGPGEAKDIWTTDTYPHTDVPRQGGGLDDFKLEVGGWDDIYHSLIEFDLSGLPASSPLVSLELFPGVPKGDGTTAIFLDRITEPWDWKTQGTGPDRERLWWVDRPDAEPLSPDALPEPVVGTWYRIDLTELFNRWQDGTYPNYGVQLRPERNDNRWSIFWSGDNEDVPELRPRLVVSCPVP